jgi:Putative MetA-pathway of phenol degradation
MARVLFSTRKSAYRSRVSRWAASQFLNEHLHLGVVGYAYQQLSGDSGEGAVLGPFESRVFGIGPQIGYKFDVNDKGYYEFGSKHRPEGWNVWLTLSFSPAPEREDKRTVATPGWSPCTNRTRYFRHPLRARTVFQCGRATASGQQCWSTRKPACGQRFSLGKGSFGS